MRQDMQQDISKISKISVKLTDLGFWFYSHQFLIKGLVCDTGCPLSISSR